MSNSKLVDYKRIVPRRLAGRPGKIDIITPHCVAGQCSVETLGDVFTERRTSANYAIGPDGRVGMYCEEKDRSICSSSSANDARAITIECASDKTAPFTMKSVVFDRLVDLCVDICERNGKKKLLWLGDKKKTLAYTPAPDEMLLSIHRWYKDKDCPGKWLEDRLPELAKLVTKRLSGESGNAGATNKVPPKEFKPYLARVTANTLNIRKGPGTNYGTNGQIKDKGSYTITEEANGQGAKKWGKLKSGAGWISLDFARKVKEV